MTGITPERLAELRSRLNRLPSKLDLNTMWHAAYGLLDEIDRLRAVIEETHCDCTRIPKTADAPSRWLHTPLCRIHEIEP